MKKPRDFKIDKDIKLRVGCKGQKIAYLVSNKGNTEEYVWIYGNRKLKSLQIWINKSIKYAGCK